MKRRGAAVLAVALAAVWATLGASIYRDAARLGAIKAAEALAAVVADDSAHATRICGQYGPALAWAWTADRKAFFAQCEKGVAAMERIKL